MPTGFINEPFPTDISVGSEGGPQFRTEIAVTHGGHEFRNIAWEQSRAKWDVAYGVKTRAQLESLSEFYHRCRGRGYGFWFKCPLDHAINDEIARYVTTNSWQIQKHYGTGETELVKDAKGIVHPSIATHTLITVNNVPAGTGGWAGAHFSLHTGEIGFMEPGNMPTDAHTIRFTGWYYHPARFDTDSLSIAWTNYEAGGASVPVVEIRK